MVPTQNLPCFNEYFVLSLTVSKNDMMIQMVDKRNASLIGQDGETLTFKALLYLNVAVHVQVFRLFCVVYIPLLSPVQLGYPAITNIFVVNQIIRYNGVFAITKIFFSVPWHFVIAGFHCTVFHCQICKFVGFLLPSSSWLLKLPNIPASTRWLSLWIVTRKMSNLCFFSFVRW